MSAKREMRVGIVGAGVMAEAMIGGLLADRAVAPDALAASHPRRDRRETLTQRYGIRAVGSNAEAARDAEIVVLAVKPQMLGRVMRELGPKLSADQVVLSIVAGATISALSSGLAHAAVVVVPDLGDDQRRTTRPELSPGDLHGDHCTGGSTRRRRRRTRAAVRRGTARPSRSTSARSQTRKGLKSRMVIRMLRMLRRKAR